MDSNTRTTLVGIGCGIAGLILGAVLFGSGSPGAGDAETPPAPGSGAEVAVAAVAPDSPPLPAEEPIIPASDWKVDERTDPLSDETVKTACATSSNQVFLSPPYGPRRARLCVRQHPAFGRDVYLSLDGSGQILCRSYDGCTIQIRFDDGAVQAFSANGPSDNSSETVFVVNESRFITSAKAASRIRVQLEFYQNGNQTFDFPAKGLEW